MSRSCRIFHILSLIFVGFILSSCVTPTKLPETPNVYYEMLDGSKVSYFKYRIWSKDNDPFFMNKLKSPDDNNKTYYKVDWDSAGRMIKYGRFIHGKEVYYNVFYYTDSSRLFDSYKGHDADGRHIWTRKITRNSQGEKVRSDKYDLDDKLVEYNTYIYKPAHVTSNVINPDGKKIRWYKYFFNAQGMRLRYEWHLNNQVYYRYEIEPDTGLLVSGKKFNGGDFTSRHEYYYNDEGLRVKFDLFGPKSGRKYGVNVYKEDLRIKEVYTYKNGNKYEYLNSYDSSRYLTESILSRNAKEICKFVYERYPNKKIKRTLIYDSTGYLAAEYPDHIVKYIKKDCSTEEGFKGTIHKSLSSW